MDEQIFTTHVRQRLDDTFDDSREILTHLHRVVRQRLKQMGIWNLPPKYLGFEEYHDQSWEGSAAMDDLVQEAYLACIEKRLEKLGQHLEITGSCEGSVHRKLKWFLSDRQEKGNPIARRVFRNVRSASESLIEDGRAECSCSERLNAKSIILAVGQQSPEPTEVLQDLFADVLGDPVFLKTVHQESPGSWQMMATVVEAKFSQGMSGYKIGELAKLVGETCKRPGVVSEAEPMASNGQKSILEILADSRTELPDSRYQQSDDLESWIAKLTRHAETSVRNAQIRKRVLNMLTALAVLIREGEDIRQLSRRKLADKLGVSKSTLAEDFARLQTYDLMQEASETETES